MDDPVMDPVKTAPFDLGSGDDACLLIHGFTGSPWDLRPLGEALAARGHRVKAIRLPGHGVNAAAMKAVTAQEWEDAVLAGLEALRGSRKVCVAGLSVGALLALVLAAERPERVGALALMAPAMTFMDWRGRLLRRFKAMPLLEPLRPFVEKSGTDIEDPQSRAQAPVLARFPLRRLRDVWRVQDRAREALGRVQAPVLIASARQDHVVSGRGARALAAGLTRARRVRFIELQEGFHIMPRDAGAPVLFEEIGRWFARAREDDGA